MVCGGITRLGLDAIGKLRCDAHLKYQYSGAQQAKGRPRQYDGKVDFTNISEFIFRDAKQFTGMCDCQARSAEKLDFHVNASLMALNLARVDWHQRHQNAKN
jgi:hypothetical protein